MLYFRCLTLILILFFLNIDPGFSQDLSQKSETADILFRDGRYTEAAFIYEEMFYNYPYITDNTYKLALAHYKSHNLNKAYRFFERVINSQSYTNYPLAFFYSGKIHMQLANYETATRNFNFFSNHYKIEHPEEYKLSNALKNNCTWASTQTNFQKKDSCISKCDYLSCYGARFIEDKKISYSYRDIDSEYIIQDYQKTKNNRINSFFESIDTLKNITDINFDSKKTKAYFSVCTYSNTPFCKIHISIYNQEKWSIPFPMEIDSIYSTHPFLANDSTLYFSSTRPGGMGQHDIWIYKRRANKEVIENIGHPVNTPGNEITPSFTQLSGKLYFSSDFHKGLGGFDIFSYSNKSNKISNAGTQINSSFNDSYYSEDSSETMFVYISDRNSKIIQYDTLYLNSLFSGEIAPTRQNNIDTTFFLYFAKGHPQSDATRYEKEVNILKTQIQDSCFVYNSYCNFIKLCQYLESDTFLKDQTTITITASYSKEGTTKINQQVAQNRLMLATNLLEMYSLTNKTSPIITSQFTQDTTTTDATMQRYVKINIQTKTD